MLAKVRTPHSPALSTPAPPSFKVAYNPTPDPPGSSQFTFTKPDGSVVGSYVLVDAGTRIEVTLAGAAWSTVPVIWSVQPADGQPVVLLSSDLQTISFTVPAPSHYFHPWVFRLSVDTPLAVGIRSPNIYLTNSQPSTSVEINYRLKYSPLNGNFSFLDLSSASGQAGTVLDAELVWINTIVPYSNFTIDVIADDGSPIRFSESGPVRWSTPTGPVWMPVTPDQPTVLFASIRGDAAGQSISLRFQIEHNGVNILSPDPILINATIGDG